MIDKNTMAAIKDAKAQYDAAKKTNTAVEAKKRVLTNILLSHVDDLLETALDAEFLLKERRECERKNVELQKKIDELTTVNEPTAEKKNG